MSTTRDRAIENRDLLLAAIVAQHGEVRLTAVDLAVADSKGFLSFVEPNGTLVIRAVDRPRRMLDGAALVVQTDQARGYEPRDHRRTHTRVARGCAETKSW